MNKIVAKTVRSLEKNPAAYFSFALGVLVGAAIHLPLLPPLEDSAANILGAAGGAVLTIAGAAYLANRQATASRQDSARLIEISLREIESHLEGALRHAKSVDGTLPADADQMDWRIEGLKSSLSGIVEIIDRVGQRMMAFTGHGDPRVAITAIDAREALRRQVAMLKEAIFRVVVSDPARFRKACESGQAHNLLYGCLSPISDDIDLLLSYLDD
ncbi:hypothetical protein [Dyella sp.]|jgi:hypothetical protein|uniref:hypothetical protein n=1 Tax=Dyella sp. TaxID=1869338 RepID=UPI003F7E7670